MGGSQRFRAVLVKGDRALGWTMAAVPFAPREIWPAMVRLRVRGAMEGPAGRVTFRSSLFPVEGGASGLAILVTHAMQLGTGVSMGDLAEFWLEADLEERPAELPAELDALLDEAEGLRAWYGALSEYTRREIGKWVCGAKGGAGAPARAEQMAERMLSTMEAEVELPPSLERAFRERPRAWVGWQRMTAAQRRGELFAVFYYKTVEARSRRVEKLVDAAERRAG